MPYATSRLPALLATANAADADSLVFNRASTGLYVKALLKKLGVDALTAPRSTRYADAGARRASSGAAP